MNRFRKLCNLVKALNHPFVSDATGLDYLVCRSAFSIRCRSSLTESQPNSQTVEKNEDSAVGNEPVEQVSNKPVRKRSVIQPTEIHDLSDYGSVLRPSFNFAAYADKSPVLQKLIELGVRLYEWEKKTESVEFILTLDFDKRIRPYLSFLTKHGVPVDKLGDFITRNPLIFKEDFDDLEVRINYLRSKKFEKDMIANIITRNPKWLSIPVREIDKRLGYLQQTFNLKGDDVRSIITREPGLARVHMKTLMLNVLTLKEEMELEERAVTQLVVAEPHILRSSAHMFLSTYDYLRRVMSIPQSLILKMPKILGVRKYKIRERHEFLVCLGRAQYNPLLPGYVALSTFCKLSDEEFCEQVAKTSLDSFYEFLKTL